MMYFLYTCVLFNHKLPYKIPDYWELVLSNVCQRDYSDRATEIIELIKIGVSESLSSSVSASSASAEDLLISCTRSTAVSASNCSFAVASSSEMGGIMNANEKGVGNW